MASCASHGFSKGTSSYVNQGLINFNMIRTEWTTSKSGNVFSRRVVPTASYDNIVRCLDTNEPFENQVPLRQLISALDDIRELDGLYG